MISCTRSDGICTLTLNRPDKANSLTRDMLADLTSAVQAAQAQADKVLVITGQGKVFSAGADLDQARAGLARDGIWEALSGAIAAFDGLSVAALNGTLAGGAFGMALACDLRISVPEAKFFYPAIKLGFLPQPSDPGRLRALVGPARAKMLLAAADKIDAQTALSWGLVDRLTPADQMDTTIASLAAPALEADAAVLKGIKAMIAAGDASPT